MSVIGWIESGAGDAVHFAGDVLSSGAHLVDVAGNEAVNVASEGIHDLSQIPGEVIAKLDGLQNSVLDLIQTVTGPWGDPGVIRHTAQAMSGLAIAFDNAKQVMQGLATPPASWSSGASEAFASRARQQATWLAPAAQAFQHGANALVAFADALAAGQQTCAAARQRVLNAGVLDLLADPGILTGAAADAHHAVDEVDAAGHVAAAAVGAAAGSAPQVPDLTGSQQWGGFQGWLQRVSANAGHQGDFLGGLLDWGAGLRVLSPAYWLYEFGTNPARAAGEAEAIAAGLKRLVPEYWLYRGVTDPAGAGDEMLQFGGALIDWRDIDSGHLQRWEGHMAPDAVLAALTLGGGAAADGGVTATDTAESAAEAADSVTAGARGLGAIAEPIAPESAAEVTALDGSIADSTGLRGILGDAQYQSEQAWVQAFKAGNPEFGIIPDDQLIAMRAYTGDTAYGPVNAALRSGDPAQISRYHDFVQAASDGLDKMPRFEGQVYRGTDLSPAQLAGYTPGRTVTEPAFTSTSADPAGAFSGNTEFDIMSQSGRDISSISHYGAQESEVLFAPGSRFKVLSVDTVNGRTIVHMLQVGP